MKKNKFDIDHEKYYSNHKEEIVIEIIEEWRDVEGLSDHYIDSLNDCLLNTEVIAMIIARWNFLYGD